QWLGQVQVGSGNGTRRSYDHGQRGPAARSGSVVSSPFQRTSAAASAMARNSDSNCQNRTGLRSSKGGRLLLRKAWLGWRSSKTNSDRSSKRLYGSGCSALCSTPSIHGGTSRLCSRIG